jgi:hypothetical protein
MASIETKNFDKPDEVRDVGKGKLNMVSFSFGKVGRAHYQPGWKWSTHQKPLEKTESCEHAHLTLIVSGRMHLKMDDGTEDEFGPGAIVSVPAGHDAWIVGSEPFIGYDFGGVAHSAKR